MNYSQYGEEHLINSFFSNKTGHFIDIGAADGEENSNTRNLVLRGWSGLLVEPCRHFYEPLNNLYKDNKNIKLFNGAVSDFNGKTKFYVYESLGDSQISTISLKQKESIEKSGWFKGKFVDTYDVEVKSPIDLLRDYGVPNKIEFVDIDAEGSDMQILKSWPWDLFEVELFCIEPSMGKDALKHFMESKGYTNNMSTDGNMFFAKKV